MASLKRKDRKALGDMALGKAKAELVIKHAKIVDVFAQRIIQADVAIGGGYIVGVGDYQGEREIDANGMYLSPGLIDSHIHIESTMVSPEALAEALIGRGTTCLIADPHEIANVKGVTGIEYMINASKDLPLRIFYMLPSCVPATDFEHGGAILEASELSELMEDERVLGLGEMMNYPGLFAGDQKIFDKLDMVGPAVIDGHGPLLTGKQLNDYALQGILTDHESTTAEELTERIAKGMVVSIREGSASRDLDKLLPGLDRHNWRRCTFCTDDRHPEHIIEEGHIDYILRRAVNKGIDPIQAITMATFNAASTYQLRDLGAVAPGYRADLVLFDNLTDFNTVMCITDGQVVYQNGQLTVDIPRVDTSTIRGTINLWDVQPSDFKIELETDIARVIRIIPRSLITEKVYRRVTVDENSYFKTHQTLDIVKLAVLDRYSGTKQIGQGLLENYGIKNGAIAISVTHDCHHIICTGDNDEDMSLAVKTIESLDGGIALVKNGEVLSSLALPLGGVMSDLSVEQVGEQLVKIRRIAYEELNVNREIDPIMILSFLGLPVIPTLKLTSKGLFDVTKFKFTNISVEV